MLNQRKLKGLKFCGGFTAILLVGLLVALMFQIVDLVDCKREKNYYYSLSDVSSMSCGGLCPYDYYNEPVRRDCCSYNRPSDCVSKYQCISQRVMSLNVQIDNDIKVIVLMGIAVLIMVIILCYFYRSYRKGKNQNRLTAPRLNQYLHQGVYHPFADQQGGINSHKMKENSRTQAKHHDSFTHRDSVNYCCICLQVFLTSKTVMLACGHLFHSQCIRDWQVKNQTCPICRSKQ